MLDKITPNTGTRPSVRRRRSPRPIYPGELRQRMEDALERLLAALDALEAPQEDMEEDDDPGVHGGSGETCDDEASLGATEGLNQARTWEATPNAGAAIDLEADDGDNEEDDDPGGDINDEPQLDESDKEPSLGATHAVNQEDAWRGECGVLGGGQDLEEEHDGCEPEWDAEPAPKRTQKAVAHV